MKTLVKPQTGPRTAAGKLTSRKNAAKHGILAKTLIVEDGFLAENRGTFEQMVNAFYKDLSPVGAVELMLVDRVVSTYWKIYRLARAERASVEEASANHFLDTRKAFIEHLNLVNIRYEKSHAPYQVRLKSSLECEDLLEKAIIIRQELELEGLPLPEECKEWLFDMGLEEKNSPAFHLFTWTYCREGKEPKVDPKSTALGVALEESLRKNLAAVKEAEALKASAEQASLVLPNTEDLQKFQRYEAHLHKMLMQTLHELQRLQALRKGCSLEATAVLDIT